MSIAGLGIDIVEIARFKRIVSQNKEKFLERIFTDREQKYAGSEKAYFVHMAGKYAAKEAVKKALPDGAQIGLNWRDIEILNGEDGKPYVILHGQAKRLKKKFDIEKIHLSISHSENIAISNAVAEVRL